MSCVRDDWAEWLAFIEVSVMQVDLWMLVFPMWDAQLYKYCFLLFAYSELEQVAGRLRWFPLCRYCRSSVAMSWANGGSPVQMRDFLHQIKAFLLNKCELKGFQPLHNCNAFNIYSSTFIKNKLKYQVWLDYEASLKQIDTKCLQLQWKIYQILHVRFALKS